MATRKPRASAPKSARTPARTTARKSAKPRGHASSAKSRRWSKRVTEHSDALDLQQGVFKESDPKAIARSLKRSSEHSDRRKSDPFRSAMSMLTFYINRAGHNLSRRRLQVLQRAKQALREVFHRPPKTS
jgi:hypothetical protein